MVFFSVCIWQKRQRKCNILMWGSPSREAGRVQSWSLLSPCPSPLLGLEALAALSIARLSHKWFSLPPIWAWRVFTSCQPPGTCWFLPLLQIAALGCFAFVIKMQSGFHNWLTASPHGPHPHTWLGGSSSGSKSLAAGRLAPGSARG